MKQSYILFCMIGVFCASCANSPAVLIEGGWHGDARSNMNYRRYTASEKVLLMPDAGSKSPALDFKVDLLDAANPDLKLLLNKTLYDGQDCKQYAAARLSAAQKKYLGSKPDDAALLSSSYNWEYIETGSGSLYKSILAVERHRYIFEGGAHGSSELECFVLDTAGGKQLRLTELLAANSLGEIKKYAEAGLAAKYATAAQKKSADTTLQSLGFFENSADLPENNFLLTPDSLCFVWNPYQIAPYSFGIIRVDIPYSTIQKHLNDKGKAVFAAMQKK